MLEKYGGEKHLNANILRNTAVTENEQFLEYDAAGAIKGVPQAEHMSKYVEDVHVNNHTAVWGSWWREFHWGYACCRSTVKNSYCTGEQGMLALHNAEAVRTGRMIEDAPKSHEDHREADKDDGETRAGRGD